MIQKRMITPTLIDAYYNALQGYTDNQIRQAGYLCMDELSYFPRIPEIKERIKTGKDQKHNKELKERFTCPVCQNYVALMIEGKCPECFNGVPIRYGRQRVIIPSPESNERDYVIAKGFQCSGCVAVGNCIKEPVDSDGWRCLKCYSDLTPGQYRDKMRGIVSSIGDMQ